MTAAGTAPRPGAKDRRVASSTGSTWRCWRCGELSRSWAAAERHSHAEGHVRIEVVL